MGKTKAELARWKTQVREGAAARKQSAGSSHIGSPSSSGEGPPPKRAKLTNPESSAVSGVAAPSSRPRKQQHHQQNQDDKLTKAFFPIGLPLEDEEGEQESGERELDEAERYILSVRKVHPSAEEEEKKLPSFVTAYNPYVLPEQASSYVGKQDVVYVARPSGPAPSFAPPGPAPSPADIKANRLRPPHPMMPTRLWRQRFLANFIQLRANLKHPSTQPNSSNPGFSTSLNPPSHYVPVPGPGEREKWRQYIVGATRKKVKVNKQASSAAAAVQDVRGESPAAGKREEDASRASSPKGDLIETGRAAAPPPPPSIAVSAPHAVADDDEEEAQMNAAPAPAPSAPLALYLGEEDDDDEGYAFTDPTIEDGTQWYGADFDDEEEELFGAPAILGGEMDVDADEEEQAMNDSSSSDEEEEEKQLELEPEQPKHLPKEPSLTLLQTLPESTHIPLLTHLTHFLRPPPTLFPTHRQPNHTQSSSSTTISHPPHPTLPTLTPLFSSWILSLLSLLPPYISPAGIALLRDLARLCMEILESYAGGKRDGAGGANEGAWGQGEEERMGCWMIWGVVVEVWAQRDLVGEAEVVFGSF